MKPDKITVHMAYTLPDMNIGADEIRRWHTDPKPDGNGWNDIGYHWVIRRSGKVEKGRNESVQGAHVGGHNENNIGICLVGGMNENEEADFNFTIDQILACDELIAEIRDRHGLDMPIYGHRDFDPSRKCPGFDARIMFDGD